jgi:hypothetical protein
MQAARNTQTAALVTLAAQASARTSAVAMLLAHKAPSSKLAKTSQAAQLLATSSEGNVVTATTQVAALVVFATGVPDPSRTRAWTFTLDGHTFYVLDLGEEGTFAYDKITQQWCRFRTQGFDQWNMANGVMWGDRPVASDLVTPYVWELNPDAVLDEGWRDIEHIATGGLQTRTRVYRALDAFKLTGSVGQLDEVNGATLRLRFSDDQAKTWSDYFDIDLAVGEFDTELAWRSLGSFAAPGRIFEVSDIGGLIRIDGADAAIDGFDGDGNASTTEQGGG